MKKAIIHIGAHKTGSTAVQVVLFENAKALKKLGITYPINFPHPQGKRWCGQHFIPFALQRKDTVTSCCESPDSLVERLQMLSRSDHLLLSSEVFCLLNLEQVHRLREMLKGFDVEVLFYVRRQDEAMQALYQTDVVHYKVSQDFDSYFKKNSERFDYLAIAQTWAEVFGKDKIHVRRYEREEFVGNDVVNDFTAALEGILGQSMPAHAWVRSLSEVNHGLPAHVVKLVAYFCGRKNGVSVANAIINLAYQLYPKGQGQYEIISPSSREAIMVHFKPVNDKLAQEFLGTAPGSDLFRPREITQTDEQWREKNYREGANLRRLALDAAQTIRKLNCGLQTATQQAAPAPAKGGRPDKRRYGSLHKIAAGMTAREWAEAIGDATERPVTINGVPLPGAPDPVIQAVFSNDSGKGSILQTALPIYEYAMSHVRAQGIEPRRLMDFGCGWGRITRLFLRDVNEAGLYGVDPWDEAIQLARTHMPFACFVKSELDPPLPFVDNFFDVVFANSVFTHLSLSSSIDWGREIARVLRPGGILVATIRPRKFIDTLEGLKAGKAPRNAWETRIRNIETGGDDLRTRYDQGEFIYLDSQGTGKDGKYGLAFLPEGVLRKEWTGMSIVEYLPDPPKGLKQGTFVMRKQ